MFLWRFSLKGNRILSASLTIIIIAFSFVLVTYSLQDGVIRTVGANSVEGAQPLMLSVSFMAAIGYHKDYNSLNQSTRMEIYAFVKNNPGTHFRGICDSLGLPIGVVQYHLRLLTRARWISVYHDRRYRRYFESKRFGLTEMKIISLLRHETAGRILTLLSERGSIFHKDLAFKLDMSSQALTWQINRLRKMGLIDVLTDGMKVRYLLNGEKAITVKECLGFLG